MEFSITRAALLKPLQQVVGAVDNKRQAKPILSHVFLQVKTHQLVLTATDLEVELLAQVPLSEPAEAGEVTLPARKFIDLCRSLADDAVLKLKLEGAQVVIKVGRSKFTLSTLPASDFPKLEHEAGVHEFNVLQKDLNYLFESTAFAVAQGDARIYLRGMLIEIEPGEIRAVASDGHRLASCVFGTSLEVPAQQFILPRKAVVELQRLLADEEASVCLTVMPNHCRVASEEWTFTTQLIDSKYPNYQRVIPKTADKEIVLDNETLKQALSRVLILTSEKHRGVRLALTPEGMIITAHNPEQEEAVEEVEMDYQGERCEFGFNGGYIIDVLNHLPAGEVVLRFTDESGALLMQSSIDDQRLYVLMSMLV